MVKHVQSFCFAYLISVLLFSLMSPSSLLKLNRDLRERFRLARQQLCTCIMILLSQQDYDVKVPNFTFCGGFAHKTAIFFFFSSTLIQSLRIQLQTTFSKIWQTERDGISPLNLKRGVEREVTLRWCYTRRFATTIFSAPQHYNIVAILPQMVATLFQHCEAVLC